MITDLPIKTYYFLPYSLKVLTTSIMAYHKNKNKYGDLYERYYQFLLSNGSKQQNEKAEEELGDFLEYTKNNCHFYKRFVSKDYNIKNLPIIDKDYVNQHYSEFLLNRPFFVGKSSGTTGQPLKVPYSKNVYQKEYAFWWYHRSFGGVYRGDKIATFGGHRVASVNFDKPPFWVFNSTENQMFFSSYHLSRKNMPHYIKELKRFRPDFIHGYPSSLYYVSKFILEENVQLNFKPKMIVGSSETTLDFHRKTIEKAFNTKCFVWYGNTEFCGHITECPHGRLHIQPYHSFVRVLTNDNTDAKPGEIGRLVATNFSNYSFALINYDIKDTVKISEKQECPCDRGGMVLDYIHGRIEDYILTPEGRFVGRLDHLFKDAKYVRNAQIVQNNLNAITIRIEKENRYSKKIEEAITKEARIRLGKTIDIRFQYVSEIERQANGKVKFIVQNINLET